MMLFLFLVTVLFGVLRFVVPVEGKINKQDIFKDLAHIWVGLLIGVAFFKPEVWFLAGGITALEVVAFFVRRKS